MVDASVNVGIFRCVIVIQSIYDSLGLLGCCRVVQVDQPLLVNRFCQDGEVQSDPVRVEGTGSVDQWTGEVVFKNPYGGWSAHQT
jgi:hypothetical protein